MVRATGRVPVTSVRQERQALAGPADQKAIKGMLERRVRQARKARQVRPGLLELLER